jgi:hypothetical protein
MIKPPPNVLDLPLHERAEMALKAAVEKLIVESARLGRSIYIERNDGSWKCRGRSCESWLHELRLTEERRPESHDVLAEITGITNDIS